jgi:HK97 family phage prohead protease
MNESKAFTVDIKADGDGLKAGEFVAIMSAPTLDRDLEVIDAGAFAPLPEKITVDIDHAMSVRSVVASGTPFYDGDLLKIKGRFASTPLGQEVRTLVREGHLDRMSVTFRAAQRDVAEDGVTHIKSAELLNVAFVVIPSNRDAAVLAAKSADERTGKLTPDEARSMLAAKSADDVAAAEVVELDGIDAVRADVARLANDLDQLSATVAELVTKSLPPAPEAAPAYPPAVEAVDERAADRQSMAAKARASLAQS